MAPPPLYAARAGDVGEILALGRLGAAQAAPVLERVLAHPEADGLTCAIAGLGEMGDAAALPGLKALQPQPWDWYRTSTIYLARYRLAPQDMADVAGLAGNAVGSLADAFIVAPTTDAAPWILKAGSQPDWWLRQAAWKGIGRLPRAAAIAELRTQEQGMGVNPACLPLDALLARMGDAAALDRVIDALWSMPETVLCDDCAREVQNTAMLMAGHLSPRLGAHLVERILPRLDLAHVDDGILSLLAAARPLQLPAQLMALWPAAASPARAAILRYLAQEHTERSRTFIMERFNQAPDAEEAALALRRADLGDPVLRQLLLATLLHPQAIVAVEQATHGLGSFPDTAQGVADFLMRIEQDQDSALAAIKAQDEHAGILADDRWDQALSAPMLRLVHDSTRADIRSAALRWLRLHLALDLRPVRHQELAAAMALMTQGDPATSAAARKCLQEFASEGGDQGNEYFYCEGAQMAGASDDLASAAQLDQDRRAIDLLLASSSPQAPAPKPAPRAAPRGLPDSTCRKGVDEFRGLLTTPGSLRSSCACLAAAEFHRSPGWTGRGQPPRWASPGSYTRSPCPSTPTTRNPSAIRRSSA